MLRCEGSQSRRLSNDELIVSVCGTAHIRKDWDGDQPSNNEDALDVLRFVSVGEARKKEVDEVVEICSKSRAQ